MAETSRTSEAKEAGNIYELALDIMSQTSSPDIHWSPSSRSSFDSTLDTQSLHGVFGKRQSNRASKIIEQYRQHELGKAILSFAIPVSTGLMAISSKSNPLVVTLVAVSLCIGFVAIWNGLLLRAILQGISIRLEQFGVAVVLDAFFGLVSTFLPLGVPFVVTFL